jgi:hypothetical protein
MLTDTSTVRRVVLPAVVCAAVALAVLVYCGSINVAAADFSTDLVDVNSAGQQATGGASRFPSVSDAAGIIAFDSRATNLVSDDSNGFSDVFVRYRDVPETIRASVSTSGVQANGDSDRPSIDQFAQFAAFESFASNLVPGDTNGVEDVFVRGLLANPNQTTQRVSVSSTGAQGNGSSATPVISANGRYVAFVSNATNLVSGDTNGVRDIFVHDLMTGKTKRVSVGIHGQANGPSQLPAISGDGRCIAFASSASNLVPGDTNNATDIFVRDTVAKTTTRVSVASDGTQANGNSSDPSINSCDDVVFDSLASNLVSGDTNGVSDVFEKTPGLGTTRLSMSPTGEQANGDSIEPVISGNDQFVAYTSSASNLVPGDTNLDPDVFRVDTLTGETERWSLATNGAQAAFGLGTGQPSITTAGGSIAFASDASNLVPGDGLLSQDIFLRHP